MESTAQNVDASSALDAARIAAARSTIDAAASALCQAQFEGTALNHAQWLRIVESTLTGDHTQERDAVANRGLLRRACMTIAVTDRDLIAFELGAIAKTAQLRTALELTCVSNPLRLTRGALAAYAALTRTKPIGDTVVALPAIALWVLGILEDEKDSRLPELMSGPNRNTMKALARQTGWIAMIAKTRADDIRWLLKGQEATMGSIERMLALVGDTIDIVNVVTAADLPASDRVADHAALTVATHSVSDPECLWIDAKDSHEMLQELTELVADRGDVLVWRDQCLVIEPQGFWDALLSFATFKAGDKRNSIWHERAVSRALLESWHRKHEVHANVSWMSSLPVPSPPSPLAVDGEFDGLILHDRVLIDIQAKSARSPLPVQREKLAATGALAQHRKLQAHMGDPIWLLAYGRFTTSPRGISRADTVQREIIPITVGTDVVHRWQIGGANTRDGFPRVLTTLDHMRIVNDYLPRELRPMYWLDRYAQEFHELRFIDEIDFLTKWHSCATQGMRHVEIRFYENAVLATDSEIEADLALRSMAALARNPPPDVSKLLTRSRAPIARMNAHAAPLTKLLGDQALHASADYLAFARAVIGNPPADIRGALDSGNPTILHQGMAKVSFHPEQLSANDAEMLRFHGVGLSLCTKPGARCIVRVPGTAGGPGFRTARFDPSRGVVQIPAE